MIAKIAKIFLLLIAFLLGLEIIFKVFFHPPLITRLYIPSSNPNLSYELRPGLKIAFKGIDTRLPPVQIAISSDGSRDYRYTVTKPQGTFRIIILGDSIAFGWGVELEDTFTKRLEVMLNNRHKRKYEVINFSVPGYNTLQDIEVLKTKALNYQPDLVIVTLIKDDFLKVRRPAKSFFLRYFGKYSSLCNFVFERMLILEGRQQMIAYAPAQGLKDVTEAFLELKKLSIENKFDVLILASIDDTPFMQNTVKQCKEYGFAVIDWSAACSHMLSKRDSHPDREGHRLIAGQIYEYLLPKLNDESTRPYQQGL